MKDITSTSFGLVIAFLLPGLAGFYGLSLFSPSIRQALDLFLTAQANAGLFFLVVLAALTLGLLITVIRWLIFELLVFAVILRRKGINIPTASFEKLSDETKLAAFRAAVDEHYRYHQFFGGMTVVMPLIFYGWRTGSFGWVSDVNPCLYWILATLLLLAIFSATCAAYTRYTSRTKSILM